MAKTKILVDVLEIAMLRGATAMREVIEKELGLPSGQVLDGEVEYEMFQAIYTPVRRAIEEQGIEVED